MVTEDDIDWEYRPDSQLSEETKARGRAWITELRARLHGEGE